MSFDAFIKDGKVILGEKDIQKARALIKMSENTLVSAESLELNDTTASVVLTLSYEALREIIEAMCLTKGYKVYSHEAFTSYLEQLKEERLAAQFDRFRKLRNGVNYYGKEVSPTVAAEAKKNIKEMCRLLKVKYLGGL